MNGVNMKAILAVFIVVAISGCANGQLCPKSYNSELAYKCHTDPYGNYCLNPPAVLKN